MVWTVPALSVVTSQLLAVLNAAVNDLGFAITVSGDAPDTVRSDVTCHLNLYLLHVSRDPSWRNSTVVTRADGVTRVESLPVSSAPNPVAGRRQQPLGLSLSYLLTAFASSGFQQEQDAMSAALRAFHEQPIYRTDTEQFTLQVESDSIEEMSRFWQAVTVPIRLSALFRVAVIFLEPTDGLSTPALPPKSARVVVGTDLSAAPPQLFQAATELSFTNIPAEPGPGVGVSVSAPAFVAGQAALLGGIVVGGMGLDQVGLGKTFALQMQVPGSLSNPVRVSWNISSWLGGVSGPNQLRVVMPAAYALGTYSNSAPATQAPPPPAAAPVPGLYQLVLTSSTTTSIPIPFAVAPTVLAPSGVTFPVALLPEADQLFTIQGGGFVPSQTQLELGAHVLTATSSDPPALPGQFFITGDAATLRFLLPSNLSNGRYFIRIRTNGVESAPSYWVDVP